MLFPPRSRLYRNFHILPKSGQKLHQAANRKIPCPVPHERGNVRLLRKLPRKAGSS